MNLYKKFIITLAIFLSLMGTYSYAFTWEINQSLIRVGSSGQQVQRLQECLNAFGNNPSSNIDGEFGPITRSAVILFQLENGLLIDGNIGDQTGPYYQEKCSIVDTWNNEYDISFSEIVNISSEMAMYFDTHHKILFINGNQILFSKPNAGGFNDVRGLTIQNTTLDFQNTYNFLNACRDISINNYITTSLGKEVGLTEVIETFSCGGEALVMDTDFGIE